MSTPRRALVVIDAQQEYFEGLLQVQYPDREDSSARIVQAMDEADQADVPVVLVQHQAPAGSPVFAPESATYPLRPEIEERAAGASLHVSKTFGSVFVGTGLEEWLREREIDTVTLVGYMTNNCVLASAAGAEPLGISVEVLSDATGAIDLVNEAGSASARQVHETIMALLNSNWASVATTQTWTEAVRAQAALPGDNLIESAARGRAQA
ncbi:nicotinamidase-related amidase [Brevibacterium sanguinis]|uniref:Nicotinamidase-related amidase n=2 Tax=Brevibacterium TaxID=1696 RepID=A0A366IQE3_9MICO|nr:MULTISPECIES: isochorismatase family protein [Brevibacterium]RBP68087.1 nicotinamidase-related amidase [Brevibacterium sanguinis]RBP74496.1 nicotinamidase-related amidase [Brevibacterium celere]